MMRVEDAIRSKIVKRKGTRYWFLCICGRELGGNQGLGLYELKRHTGKCISCLKTNTAQRLLTNIKWSAKSRGIDFDLTLDQLTFYVENIGCCYYCGSREIQWRGTNRTNLDRLDSSRGYTANNIVVCCWKCNDMKGNLLSRDEMVVAMLAVRACRAGNPEQRSELELTLSAILSEFSLPYEALSANSGR